MNGQLGHISSGNYVPDGAGFILTKEGNAEFNNLKVRGELSATVFKYDEVSAVAGTLGVFKSAGVLKEDLTIGWSEVPGRVYITDGTPVPSHENGDLWITTSGSTRGIERYSETSGWAVILRTKEYWDEELKEYVNAQPVVVWEGAVDPRETEGNVVIEEDYWFTSGSLFVYSFDTQWNIIDNVAIYETKRAPIAVLENGDYHITTSGSVYKYNGTDWVAYTSGSLYVNENMPTPDVSFYNGDLWN